MEVVERQTISTDSSASPVAPLCLVAALVAKNRSLSGRRFCAFCGADIGRGIETFQEAISVLRDQTQSLRSSYRHEEVLRKLGPLIESPHPALGSHAEWARQQHQILTEELSRLQKQRTDLHGAANDQLNQGNFNAARKHLDSIPDALRTDESTELSNLIEQRETECKLLTAEIQRCITAREYDGLHDKVTRFLELKPDHEKGRELLARLKQRQSRAATAKRPEGDEHELQGGDEEQPVDRHSEFGSDDAAYEDEYQRERETYPVAMRRRKRSTTWRQVARSGRARLVFGLIIVGVLGVTFWPQQSQQTVPSQAGQSIDNDNTKVALSPAPAVAPFDAAQAKAHQQAWAAASGLSHQSSANEQHRNEVRDSLSRRVSS